MKTKFLLSALFTFVFYFLSSQVPQGINYQGIARNGTVPITTTLPVRITIQSDSLGGSVYWVEEHASIKPNESGLFSLVVGTGKKISGISSFGDIDWSSGQKYIKTEINYDGWLMMGSSRIWAVPYSMVAKGLGGPLDKLGVLGKTSNMEEALFEVKNKDGQTIFAVYNEGVRVYVADGDVKGAKGGFAIGGFDLNKGTTHELFVVSPDSIRAYIYDDPATKGAKGGFAIGGFDLSKGITNDYLLISPDSARIYVDNAPSTKGAKGGFAIGGFDLTKGISQKFLTVSNDSIRMYIDDGAKGAKGGFAIGGFDLGKGDNVSYLNVTTDATGIINPSQNRILWYPLKNAFLTGKVIIENPDSVGENSFASGFESKARGNYSQALGFNVISRGNYATAIGKNAIAHSDNSVSIGNHSRADNISSFAFGTGAIALGENSYAIGSSGVDSLGMPTGNTMSIGGQSFAIGMGSRSLGFGSFAIGIADTASGDFSVSLGYRTKSSGLLATAIGRETLANGSSSIAIGFKTTSSGSTSTSMGNRTTASGSVSLATGDGTLASGGASTAMGAYSIASNSVALAAGLHTTASGKYSTSLGFYTTASGKSSLSAGFYSTASGEFSTSIGANTSALTCYETVLGRYNIYNDGAGPFTWSPWDMLFVIGNGTAEDSRSNAFTVLKNGMIAVGHAEPTEMLDINGQIRIRGGNPGSDKVLTSYSEGTARWELLDASKISSGILKVSNGGTGVSDLTQNKILIGNGTSGIITSANLSWDDFFENFGIGISSPLSKLHVVDFDENGGTIRVESNCIDGQHFGAVLQANTGTLGTGCYAAGSQYDFYAGGAGVNYASPSSIRWKANVNDIDNALAKIMRVRAVYYDWDDKHGGFHDMGFIGEELAKVIPEIVMMDPESPDYAMGVDYGAITPLLVQAIKEQQDLIEEKDLRIKSLEERLVQIESILGINNLPR